MLNRLFRTSFSKKNRSKSQKKQKDQENEDEEVYKKLKKYMNPIIFRNKKMLLSDI